MASLADHYAALGVRPDADAAQIRRAWIRAARANHPDGRGDSDAAQAERSDRRMRAVNEAWRVLGRAESRRAYDLERAAAGQPGSRAGPNSRPSAARPDGSAGSSTAAGWGAPSASRASASARHGLGDVDDFDVDDFAGAGDDGALAGEPGGPGNFVVSHRSVAFAVRVLPWLTIAVVGIVIFVASAYLSASNDLEQSEAALQVGSCYWTAPDGRLVNVSCNWTNNDGVLDQIITMSSSDRCRNPDAEVRAAPIAGRRLCLVPTDRWTPPADAR